MFTYLNLNTFLGYRFFEQYHNSMPDTISHFEGKYLSLRQIDTWEFAHRPNAKGVVAIFALTPDRKVILVEQFRIPTQSHVIEICAGLVGDEPEHQQESLAECAQRELLEETGYTPGKMTHLLSSPSSAGMTDEITHLFLAENCLKTAQGGGVDGENITTHLIPFNELLQFLEKSNQDGILIDFKIHSCLGQMALIDRSKYFQKSE